MRDFFIFPLGKIHSLQRAGSEADFFSLFDIFSSWFLPVDGCDCVVHL